MSERVYEYDVFISHSDADRAWVEDELLPWLEGARLRVISDLDFEVGVARLINIERAVEGSRHTLVVLTPEWLSSEWAAFESLLIQTDDPAGLQRRMIPLLLRACELPKRIAMLERADLTDPDSREEGMARLLRGLGTRAHLFLCYKHDVAPDHKLAVYLSEFLTLQGHGVFMDTGAQIGEAWLEEVDRQIQASDYLIVLLSAASADDEMMQAEVRRAYEYRKRQGHPRTLPVRVAYEGLVPYAIDALLDPLQYVVWGSEADDERVGQDILAIVEGRLSQTPQAPFQIAPAGESPIIFEDGRPLTDDEALHPPLPAFDPRLLEELEVPEGTVRLRSRFYVEREDDANLRRQVVKPGAITTIRAARQTGKSSMLIRGVHHARQQGARVVNLDMQRVGRERLETPDRFLRTLAESIVRKLRLDTEALERLWRDTLGPQDKITYLLEDYVLPRSEAPIVLAIDEADRLLSTPFHSDFFALLRSWHNSAAYEDQWAKLNIVMVVSTEPYLLITDMNQSPFNVGLKLYLEDFDEAQVQDLNRRHGSPVQEGDFAQFMELLSGHPYLTRKALYTMVTERLAWTELVRVAPTDHGPFGDHLRHTHWMLRGEPDLQAALQQVIRHDQCADEKAFFRLLRAGLVKGSGGVCKCRCDLYRLYFQDKL